MYFHFNISAKDVTFFAIFVCLYVELQVYVTRALLPRRAQRVRRA